MKINEIVQNLMKFLENLTKFHSIVLLFCSISITCTFAFKSLSQNFRPGNGKSWKFQNQSYTYFQETSQLQNRKRPLAGKPRRLPETKIRTKVTTYFRSRETGPDQPQGPNVIKLFTSIFTNVCNKLKCFALASVTKLVLCLWVRPVSTLVNQLSDVPL